MLITELQLENIKSYEDAVISFAEGVNAICGPNGAGKTTILEAIGYALFNYLPYKQEDFLREGEKSGAIRVALLSSLDGRPYRVVRQIGHRATYYVVDVEALYRPAEGSDDVQRWLREHLGLDEGMDQRSVFVDTVGVPQGTLTAIFLESPGVRRPKFDRLLRVEEYEQTFKKLLETKNYLDACLSQAQRDVAVLEDRTAAGAALESQLTEIATRKAQLASLLATLSDREEVARTQLDQLLQVRDRLQTLRGTYELQRASLDALRRQLDSAASQYKRAQEARTAVETHATGHKAYQSATARLQELAAQRTERDQLRQRLAELDRKLAALESNRVAVHQRLTDCVEAEVRCQELGPAAKRQEELEAALRQAQDAVQSLSEVQREVEQRRLHRAELIKSIDGQRREVQILEQQRPAAAARGALVEEINGLLGEIATFKKHRSQLEKTLAEHREVERKLERTREELGSLNATIARIEPLREKARQADEAETLLRQTEARLAELRASLEQVRLDRQQVAGGICPFLRESCRNLREGMTLETFLHERQTRLQEQLRAGESGLEKRRAAVAEVRSALQQVDRLPDLYRQHETLERQLAESMSVAEQVKATTKELATLPQLLTAKQVRQSELSLLIKEAHEADQRVAAIPAKQTHLASLEKDLQDEERRLTILEQRRTALLSAPDEAARIRQQLTELGDPRTAYRMAQERAAARCTTESELARLDQTTVQLTAVRTEITAQADRFATLDADYAAQTALQQRNLDAYQSYLRNMDTAQTLEACKSAAEKLEQEVREAEQSLEQLGRELASAESTFDAAALEQAQQQVGQLSAEIGAARADIRNNEAREDEKAAELDEIRALQKALAAVRAQSTELTELSATLDFLRSTIKNAGPHVTEILLHTISAQATGINADIMGTRAAELEWTTEYEILLHQRGQDRSFRQLSGGEQMSAALAVRLALLRELSGIDVAFFDEPTQNMDQERRTNLAEQIPNLRGFSQLFVITHDDSFETSVDHVVRVEKKDGRSTVVGGA
ncbi:MAG: SMC family ATPase [Chloroflexota bacterium]|nr:MAG: SMC family ATPase [Chloroflexota bacterium]